MPGFNYILVDVDDGLFVIGSAYRNYNIRSTMRTTIDIDDDLLAEAMAATGLATKKATVDEALRLLARQHRRRQAIQDMAKLGWEGDLDAIRKSRPDDPRLCIAADVIIATFCLERNHALLHDDRDFDSFVALGLSVI